MILLSPDRRIGRSLGRGMSIFYSNCLLSILARRLEAVIEVQPDLN